MRVLHLNTYTRLGGAALGTYFLHNALLQKGIESILCTKDGGSDTSDGVFPAPEYEGRYIFRNTANRVLNHVYPNARWGEFSHSICSTLNLKKAIALYRPDVLHLHWINDGFLNPKWLSKIDIPIVVTLRDFWFLTGGCHYLDGCKRHKDGCGECPKLGSNMVWDISRYQRNVVQQLQSHPRIEFVAISSWMKNAVLKMVRSGGFNISVIPNCIPFDSFFPEEKQKCREQLGLSYSDYILFYPSLNPWTDFRKGGNLLMDAICRNRENDSNLAILCCDDIDKTIGTKFSDGVKIISLAKAKTGGEMRLRYGASDCVVVPSVEEAFGKVTAEALACARPVVAFSDTGADDIVDHMKTGYLAKNGDEYDLSLGISWAMQHSYALNSKPQELLNHVKTRFSSDIVAKEYIDLYKRLLK